MQVNNITVPDPSVSKEYFADPIGGWLYEVVTEVSVSQLRLDSFDKIVKEKQDNATKAQAELTEANAKAAQFADEIAQAKQAQATADAAFIADKEAKNGK